MQGTKTETESSPITTGDQKPSVAETLRTAMALLMVEADDHDENRVIDRERRKNIAKLIRDFINRAHAALDQGTSLAAHGNHDVQAPAVEAQGA
jgi:hypothetical protein